MSHEGNSSLFQQFVEMRLLINSMERPSSRPFLRCSEGSTVCQTLVIPIGLLFLAKGGSWSAMISQSAGDVLLIRSSIQFLEVLELS